MAVASGRGEGVEDLLLRLEEVNLMEDLLSLKKRWNAYQEKTGATGVSKLGTFLEIAPLVGRLDQEHTDDLEGHLIRFQKRLLERLATRRARTREMVKRTQGTKRKRANGSE